MIDHVLDFSALPVGELAEPLPEGFVLHRDAPPPSGADLLAFARRRESSFLPVFDADGTLVALLDLFVLLLEQNPGRPAAAYQRRAPLVVAPEEPALRVLRRLRSLRLGAAVLRSDGGRPTKFVPHQGPGCKALCASGPVEPDGHQNEPPFATPRHGREAAQNFTLIL